MKKSIIIAILLASFLAIGCTQQPNQPAQNQPNSGQQINGNPPPQPSPQSQESPSRQPNPFPFPQFPQPQPQMDYSNCQKPVFTEYFVDPSYLLQVGQVGTVHGSGQFTIERSYISVKNEFNRQKIPIYAPTRMTLRRGAHYQVPAPAGQYLGEPLPDYVVYFDAGCGVELAWGHLKEMVPSIANQFSEPKQDSRTVELQPVEFAAGDLIGYYIPGAGVAAFDFFAYDQSVTNQFANQARHEFGYGDPMLHAVCPYDYYSGEQKQAYYSLIGGKDAPVGKKTCGDISRDYPGTISGMWFLNKEPTSSIYDYSQEGTYGSALPIAGDPDRVIIGTVGQRASTFIYPSDPTYKDPKEITDEHCYRTTQYNNPSESAGYIYFKLLDDETLKVIYSENGQCPDSFPSSGGATYYR